jgi:hypothetical protein
MDARIKQLIMEMLRRGEDPIKIQDSLNSAYNLLNGIKHYQPDHDLADFYRAYKDADFRP